MNNIPFKNIASNLRDKLDDTEVQNTILTAGNLFYFIGITGLLLFSLIGTNYILPKFKGKSLIYAVLIFIIFLTITVTSNNYLYEGYENTWVKSANDDSITGSGQTILMSTTKDYADLSLNNYHVLTVNEPQVKYEKSNMWEDNLEYYIKQGIRTFTFSVFYYDLPWFDKNQKPILYTDVQNKPSETTPYEDSSENIVDFREVMDYINDNAFKGSNKDPLILILRVYDTDIENDRCQPRYNNIQLQNPQGATLYEESGDLGLYCPTKGSKSDNDKPKKCIRYKPDRPISTIATIINEAFGEKIKDSNGDFLLYDASKNLNEYRDKALLFIREESRSSRPEDSGILSKISEINNISKEDRKWAQDSEDSRGKRWEDNIQGPQFPILRNMGDFNIKKVINFENVNSIKTNPDELYMIIPLEEGVQDIDRVKAGGLYMYFDSGINFICVSPFRIVGKDDVYHSNYWEHYFKIFYDKTIPIGDRGEMGGNHSFLKKDHFNLKLNPVV